MKKPTLIVIGAGASGMMAAIKASYDSEDKFKVILLDRMDRIGKKILATGNGRCNFTNMTTNNSNFYGNDSFFVDYALKMFTVEDTLNFFNSIGVFPKEEQNGKIYPYSDQASSVLDALRNEIQRLNIEIKTDFDVIDILPQKTGFKIIGTNEDIFAKGVIMSTGGCASPNLGSNGSGFKIMKKLGHTITELQPALVQLKTQKEIVRSLQGIRFTGTATCFVNENIVAQEHGEILFTEYGLSGPPIFQLSCIVARNKNVKIELDFMPSYSMKEIFDILYSRKKSLFHLTAENFFTGLLNKKIGYIISKKSGIDKLSLPVSNITKDIMWNMVNLIKAFSFDVIGLNSWNNAQVTAGGVLTSEIDNTTMQSKLFKGLYVTGEILDIFGDCGGFNLQWAWSSGYVAGKSVAENLKGGI